MAGAYPAPRMEEFRGMVNGGAYVRKKTVQLRTDGATSIRASVGALWGPKQLENLPLSFEVLPEKAYTWAIKCVWKG